MRSWKDSIACAGSTFQLITTAPPARRWTLARNGIRLKGSCDADTPDTSEHCACRVPQERYANISSANTTPSRLTPGTSCRQKPLALCSSSCKGRVAFACQLHPIVRRSRDAPNARSGCALVIVNRSKKIPFRVHKFSDPAHARDRGLFHESLAPSFRNSSGCSIHVVNSNRALEAQDIL